MESTIQSSQKRFTHKFWKPDSKRRNSTPNTKKEGIALSVDSKPSLNYQADEQNRLIAEYNAAKEKYEDYKKLVLDSVPCLELCNKLRLMRTVKMAKIDNFERSNPKLEPFLASYSKNFITFKSKYDGFNKFHLRNITEDDKVSSSDIPVFDASDQLNQQSLPIDMAQQWANQSFSKIQADPLLTGLLNNLSTDVEERQSRKLREKSRQQKIFTLYSPQDYINQIDRKGVVEYPQEVVGKSIKVQIKSFCLEPDLELIFGHMCLYDLKNRKKISENFHFDINSKSKLYVLDQKTQLQFLERVPQANSCIFHVSNSSDIFLVIRIEKILQKGDANEIVDSYLKDDKHKSKLKTEIEWAWKNHTKYRMPLGVLVIELNNILSGNDKNTTSFQSSNSIDNCSINSKASSVKSARAYVNTKRHPLESPTIKSTSQSLSKDMYLIPTSNEDDDQFTALYQSMETRETHINHFYRQESDKMSDEDLFKCMQECKKLGSSTRRLKTIPCHMVLEISPIDEMNSSEYIMSPEELQLATKYQSPRSSKQSNVDRPIIDILEFPADRRFIANSIYRNLLYLYPRSVNFGSKQGSFRNIVVRTQIFHVEREEMKILPIIYNKSYGSRLATETFTKVLYHVKSPEFNDEIKIKLPAVVTGNVVVLFTFCHISCQANKKHDSDTTDVVIGYSWLPILDDGILRSNDHSLMISHEYPSVTNILRKPDLQGYIEGIKWLENHKELFRVSMLQVSTIHSEDTDIEKFNNIVSYLRSVTKSSTIIEDAESIKNSLDDVLKMLDKCKLDVLIQFSSVILDNLLWLSVDSSFVTFDHYPRIKQYFLNNLANVVNRITVHSTNKSENLNRDAVLSTFVCYAASIPQLQKDDSALPNSRRSTAERGLDQDEYDLDTGLFHEDFLSRILQCIEEGSKDLIIENLWFFLELLLRTMREYFYHMIETKRSNRSSVFSENFHFKLLKLMQISNEQLRRYIQGKDYTNEDFINIMSPQQIKRCQNLIRNLALFHNDLVTLLDPDIVKSFILDFISYVNSLLVTEQKDIVGLYVKCKLEFLMIISCSEYFLPLNGIDLPKATAIANIHISETYVVKHLLLSLIFTEIKLCWQTSDPVLQKTSAVIILNLLASHESDPRYNNPDSIRKISDTYLPLINVLFDLLKYLIPRRNNRNKASSHLCNDTCSMSSFDNNCSRTSNTTCKSIISESLYESIEEELDNNQWGGIYDCEEFEFMPLNSRHLLLCLIWLLKNLDAQTVTSWFLNLSSFKINKVLHLLLLTVVNFEYKGNNADRTMPEKHHSSSVELVSQEEKQRVTEDSVTLASVMECVLCREIIFVVLDTLEVVLKAFESNAQATAIIINILRITIKALCLNQCVEAIQRLLSFQRLIIKKYHKIIFDEYIDLCADLCKCLLSLAGAQLKEIRSHAVASLYMLMRFNFQLDNTFARIKLQITMALSRLVCDTSNPKRRKNIEINLNRSLRTVISYSDVEHELQNERNANGDDSCEDYVSFARQVQELAVNLHNILNDTVKMRQFQQDPEMQIDLMSRIAKGYQNSPDLRLAWLQMMKQKHIDLNNKAEAGMCIAHCAAIVAEYLGMKEPLPFMPVGCVQVSDAIGINLLEESATSDDVVSPDEDGMCCDELFCQEGLLKLIRNASKYFHKAAMFELIPKLNRIILPIVEEQRDYSRLSKFHGEIKDAYDSIRENANKRIFATYYRVGFYGAGFQDLNNQEYIYKEQPFAKLPEVSSKIESFYANSFGKNHLVIIKDSSKVDLSTLDNEKNYIQIIFVEPYFETAEYRRRVTVFEQNYNLKKFVYSTPYTLEGKSHGELKEQYKRKTILVTERAFPYIKTRILVVNKSQLDLKPIEVALEDLSKKVDELSSVLSRQPIDAKYLQMMLQGSIGTTVNQGPVELATSFLSAANASIHGYHYNKLKLCFKEFLRRCREGLERNRSLITSDQCEYQKELEKNYDEISRQLAPLLYGDDIVDT